MHAAAIAKRLDDPILSVRKGSLEALGRVHPTQLLAFAPAIALRLRDLILSVRPSARWALSRMHMLTTAPPSPHRCASRR